jgi:hypothetical protein
MNHRLRIFLKSIILAFCMSNTVLNAQILKDTVSLNLIKKGVDNIYNFQFNNALEVYTKINHSYPGHPIGYLFRGMIIYWENYPLLPSSPEHTLYESDLRKCIEICETKQNEADEAEFLLADLCARGLLLLYYTDNDLSMKVIPLATSTYPDIRRSFNYTSAYNDFFFFTGLYDYYREAYPEAYPVYKSLAFLFPKGNKLKGIQELQTAAKNSIVLKAESFSFLSWIYSSYENNYQLSLNYTKSLHELYPANPQYTVEYIKNLLFEKQYDEAERMILSVSNNENNDYSRAQLSIFTGIVQEKKYHNAELARQYYNQGISEISNFGSVGNEFEAYAYFGLSRICDLKGDKKDKKKYRNKALELAEFKKNDFDE